MRYAAVMPGEEGLWWQVLEREIVADFDVFRVARQRSRHPPSGRSRTFSVIECPSWVNVLALTQDSRVVFVRQYRPGVERVTLELPGGVIDPGESPEVAARRELAEETGYEASSWRVLGSVEPNPALQGNRCWSYLATGAVAMRAPCPDGDEVIEVVTHSIAIVPHLIAAGTITHSLVVSAFHLHALATREHPTDSVDPPRTS